MMNKIWFKIFLSGLSRGMGVSTSSLEADEGLAHIQNKFGTPNDLSFKEKELCDTIDILEEEIRNLKKLKEDPEADKLDVFGEEIDIFDGVVPVRHAVCAESYIWPCSSCNTVNKLTIDEYKSLQPCKDCRLVNMDFDEGDNGWDE